MIIDKLDIFIIKSIYKSKKETTTWKITKNYFNDVDCSIKSGMRIIDKKHHLIKNRLKKMETWGIIKITKNSHNKNVYNLITDNCKISKHKFPDGYKKAMILKINCLWNIFQL